MNNNTLSEDFGNLQNDGSENLKIFPNHSETNFVPFRKPSERKLSHTLTVREVARIFEEHDVPITEHTVTNWCKQNSQGICRLDGYYEEAERKWYITPESVDLTIKEERTKLRKDILNPSEAAQNFSEAFGKFGTKVLKTLEAFRTIRKTTSETQKAAKIKRKKMNPKMSPQERAAITKKSASANLNRKSST